MQSIVNTLFGLYSGFTFSESKIIVTYSSIYILLILQLLETVIIVMIVFTEQSTQQFIGYVTFDLCYLLIVVIPIAHAFTY